MAMATIGGTLTAASPSSSCLAYANDIKGESNFPQGCQFSPDGLCILTSTRADHTLRLYNTPPLTPTSKPEEEEEKETETQSSWNSVLKYQSGDSVRCYNWYPQMNSYDPSSCAFIASSRDQPVHLMDAYNGSIRASYRAYNHLDEVESPTTCTFSPDGNRIICAGFKSDRTIHVFDTARPGRDSDIWRLGKTRRSKDGQKGIVSSLAFPEMGSCALAHSPNGIFAVGTYSPGSIYIYDDRDSSGSAAGVVLHGGVCVSGHGKSFGRKKRRFVDMEEDSTGGGDSNDMGDIFSTAKVNWYHSRARGGITQLKWAGGQAGFSLFSASRRSDAILQWDLRMLTGNASFPIRGIAAFPRDGDTNQRLEFDLDKSGRRLFAPSQDGSVKIYDIQSGSLLESIDGFDDAVNGVSFLRNESQQEDILALTVGARRFNECYEDIPTDQRQNDELPGSLQLHRLTQSQNLDG